MGISYGTAKQNDRNFQQNKNPRKIFWALSNCPWKYKMRPQVTKNFICSLNKTSDSMIIIARPVHICNKNKKHLVTEWWMWWGTSVQHKAACVIN